MAVTPGNRLRRRPPAARRTERTVAAVPLRRRTLSILARTGRAFLDDNITRLGAALAFYTTVAVAPLLVLAIAVAGFFFDQESARAKVLGEIESLAGSDAGAAIATVQTPADTTTGRTTTIVGAFTLLFGAFGVFHHLQEALNSIWRVQPPTSKGWRAFLRQRVFSFATVIATGFLLLVSLVASAMLSWASGQALARFELGTLALQIVNNVLSFTMITLLFALIFKLLPDTPIRWRNVWFGAA
ncbi:MAG TPA: YhjD/YihY/BrkB family envelope integrity protein, partial [Opitutaceae bacterium]|nr:YhjD/YihY/BrkB family envelope integrity protein [Opitutaceae bacterium]